MTQTNDDLMIIGEQTPAIVQVKKKKHSGFVIFLMFLVFPVTLAWLFHRFLFRARILGWYTLCIVQSFLAIIVWEIVNGRLKFETPLFGVEQIKVWIVLIIGVALFFMNCAILTVNIMRRKDMRIVKG